MIGLLLALVAGFVFGYLAVGPANRGYTPSQWGLLRFAQAFAFGFVLFAALVVATVFTHTTGNLSIPNLLAAQGFWTLYCASMGLGAYLQQRRHRP